MIHLFILYYLLNIFYTGTHLNIHEDERMKPENWIPLGWLPIINADKSRRPTRGYECSAARNIRCFMNAGNNFYPIGRCSLQYIGLSSMQMELPGKQCISLQLCLVINR